MLVGPGGEILLDLLELGPGIVLRLLGRCNEVIRIVTGLAERGLLVRGLGTRQIQTVNLGLLTLGGHPDVGGTVDGVVGA